MNTISFDCSGKDFDEDEWGGLMRRLDARLIEADLPGLYSARWDDDLHPV